MPNPNPKEDARACEETRAAFRKRLVDEPTENPAELTSDAKVRSEPIDSGGPRFST